MNDHQVLRLSPEQWEKADQVNEGDILEPVEFWNETSRRLQLPNRCPVIKVSKPTFGQSGISFRVQLASGKKEIELDAAWFKFYS